MVKMIFKVFIGNNKQSFLPHFYMYWTMSLKKIDTLENNSVFYVRTSLYNFISLSICHLFKTEIEIVWIQLKDFAVLFGECVYRKPIHIHKFLIAVLHRTSSKITYNPTDDYICVSREDTSQWFKRLSLIF